MRGAAVVPAQQEANQNQADESSRLGESKSILDEFAGLQSARVRESEKQYQEDRHELLGRKTKSVTPEVNGPNNVYAL